MKTIKLIVNSEHIATVAEDFFKDFLLTLKF